MPTRKKGDEVSIYLEHMDSWRDGSVIKHIRGFGYECSVFLEEDDGSATEGRYPSKFVKQRGRVIRTRSRSRGRTGATQIVKRRNESPSPDRDETRKQRGRPKRDTVVEALDPAEWAWESVRGEAESNTRRRRSRSRSRGRTVNVIDAEIERRASARILGKKTLREQEVEPSTVEVEVLEQFSADEGNLPKEESSAPSDATVDDCPWIQKLFCVVGCIKKFAQVYVLLFALPYAFYHYHEMMPKSLNDLTTTQNLNSLAVLAAVGLLMHLKPYIKHDRFFYVSIVVLISAIHVALPSNFVSEHYSALGQGALLMVFAHGIVGNAANTGLEFSMRGIHNYFESFMLKNNLICARGFSRAGEILSLFVLVRHLVNCDGSNQILAGASCLFSALHLWNMWNSIDYSSVVPGNGFLFAFYTAVFLPFISLFPLEYLAKVNLSCDPVMITLATACALLSGKAAKDGSPAYSNFWMHVALLLVSLPCLPSCSFIIAAPILYSIF